MSTARELNNSHPQVPAPTTGNATFTRQAAELTRSDPQVACPEDTNSRAAQEPSPLTEADLGAFLKGA
jgi:hypothetical protein